MENFTFEVTATNYLAGVTFAQNSSLFQDLRNCHGGNCSCQCFGALNSCFGRESNVAKQLSDLAEKESRKRKCIDHLRSNNGVIDSDLEWQKNIGVFIYKLFNEQIRSVVKKRYPNAVMHDLDPSVIVKFFDQYLAERIPNGETLDWRTLKLELSENFVQTAEDDFTDGPILDTFVSGGSSFCAIVVKAFVKLCVNIGYPQVSAAIGELKKLYTNIKAKKQRKNTGVSVSVRKGKKDEISPSLVESELTPITEADRNSEEDHSCSSGVS